MSLLFREDGTGQVNLYGAGKDAENESRPMSYQRGHDTLVLFFRDGTIQTYGYTLTEDTLTLTGDGASRNWTREPQRGRISSREMGIQFWIILAGTMGLLYLQHVFMPYDYRFRPEPGMEPDLFAGNFSQGQLVQFLLQSIGMPLIYELEIVLIDWLELPQPFCVGVGVVLVLLWATGPRVLAKRIDGW